MGGRRGRASAGRARRRRTGSRLPGGREDVAQPRLGRPVTDLELLRKAGSTLQDHAPAWTIIQCGFCFIDKPFGLCETICAHHKKGNNNEKNHHFRGGAVGRRRA
ncbi:hypothetical protein MPLSOD_80070 [Mesorhizobium sp. SOD10]|nr:hypothetical protein MPLSOD_80070 [Mesorhizobium sp. SOD10]